jgi:hypothetical protein
MKKIIFYIALLLSVFLLINVIQILVTDFERLTEYGFGYLVGKIILFILFLGIVLITKKAVLKPKTE